MKLRLTTLAALLAASNISAQEASATKEAQDAQATKSAQVPQSTNSVRLEVRPFAGRYIPTGRMSDDFKSANTFGVQTAVELSSMFHVLASAGWTDGTSTIGALTNGKTAVWQYDAGVEVNGLKSFGNNWQFRPFAGAGAGARTYSYEETGVGSKTCMNGYGAVGAELQKSVIGFRLESRGYVNCFKQPLTNEKTIRADGLLSFGIAYHLF